jgi:2-oxoisovalerate dehydrogenase E2 component (dihydrolipoyl transacylase)
MSRRASVSFPPPSSTPSGKHKSLATPAVRHLIKEHNLNIEDVPGTGKDGRVLKEDVHTYLSGQFDAPAAASQRPPVEPLGEDKTIAFTHIQRKMFETMTKSLSIPHFLYTDTVDFTSLSRVRRALNSHPSSNGDTAPTKLSALPFIVKAVSLALSQYPSINAHLDTSNATKPTFTHKSSHNIGVAMDTPQGLLVPVIKNVQSHSISSLATEISRLSSLARSNKLTLSDLSDATFSISNIGSLGGTVVAPVIVSPQVSILGVGRARAVPAFDGEGKVVRKEEAVFSWSADHRVVDGATVARCAELVREYLEGTERMLSKMR